MANITEHVSNGSRCATENQVLTWTRTTPKETLKDNQAENYLIRICGPAMPLPFDAEYYLYPEAFVEDNPFDYTYGVIKEDFVGRYGKENTVGQTDDADSNEAFLTSGMVFPDFNQSPEMAQQMTTNASSSIHTWNANGDYTYGINTSNLYAFEVDSEPAGWPIPNEKYVTPPTVDTMSQVG